MIGWLWLCLEHLCWELVDLLWSISSWWPILICIHPCLSNETVIEPLRSNMEHKHVLFPLENNLPELLLGCSMLELTCKFLKPTHLVWNKSDWWFQPSEKYYSNGIIVPKIWKHNQNVPVTTNHKSSRIARNPPSKCKNPAKTSSSQRPSAFEPRPRPAGRTSAVRLVARSLHSAATAWPSHDWITLWIHGHCLKGTKKPPNHSKLYPKHFLRRYLDP